MVSEAGYEGLYLEFLAKYRLGDLASILGLILTIVGFGITIINVRKSKRAAEAAEKAATEISKKISLVNVVVSLSAATASMEDIKRLHRQQAWPLLRERYASMRKALIEVRVHAPNLLIKDQRRLQSAISYFAQAESVMESTNDNSDNIDVARLNTTLTKHVDELTELLERLKSTIGGTSR